MRVLSFVHTKRHRSMKFRNFYLKYYLLVETNASVVICALLSRQPIFILQQFFQCCHATDVYSTLSGGI